MKDYYKEFTEEEKQKHFIQFEEDVDKYVMQYKITGKYPHLYVTHFDEELNDWVTEKLDDLIDIRLEKERVEKIKNNIKLL